MLLLAAPAAHAAGAGVNITGGAVAGSQVPAAVSTGASTVRIFVTYTSGTVMDPQELAAYDGIVNGLVASGVRPVIVVSGQGAPPASISDFATFMGNLAQHFAGKVAAWEVWNEEDEAIWWGTAGGNPMTYAAILKAAYAKVHPYATVLMGPMTANNYVFLGQVYAALGGTSAGAFDAVAVHTDTACSLVAPDQYQRDQAGHVGRFSFLGVVEVRRVMVEHGDGGKPIWVTELGWNTYQGTCTHGIYAGQKQAGVSEADQAKFLSLAWHCLRGLPYVQNALWFDLTDQGGDSLYGLLRGDGSKKPSYAAFQDVAAGKDAFAGQSCGDFEPPAIAIKSPVEGGGFKKALTIDATASDPSGVSRVTLFADGVKIRNFTGQVAAAYPTTRHATIEWQGAKRLSAGPHTIRIQALDAQGNISTKDVRVIKGGSQVPPPVSGVRGGAADISGRVCIYLPHHKHCVLLHGGESIPVGSVLDTRKGTIDLVVSDGSGGTYAGDFHGGFFLFTQKKGNPITKLRLVRGRFGRCHLSSHKSSLARAADWWADAARRRVVRYLQAKAHGKFSVIGKHASGVERGTNWKVTDTCDTTEVKVIFGDVDVTDFFKHKLVTVTAGHTYVAQAGKRR